MVAILLIRAFLGAQRIWSGWGVEWGIEVWRIYGQETKRQLKQGPLLTRQESSN